MTASTLADALTLTAALHQLRTHVGGYTVVDHWQQGEFHHDTVLRVDRGAAGSTAYRFVLIATNCNGGVKEVLCFDELPDRSALWHWRCPDSPEFAGKLPPLVDYAKTLHWFDPCELLTPDARSEYRAEARERQPGGGWKRKA